MPRTSLSILFLLLLFFAGNLFSQDSVVEKKDHPWSFNGYVKDMQTVIVHNVDQTWISSNLVHNRLNFRWNISNSVTFVLEERNRFYWGDLVGISPGYKDFIAYDNGLFNLSRNLAEGKSYILNAAVDRAWLDFTRGNFQVTAGRQRINWSQTFVWNPNDIFNTYSYCDYTFRNSIFIQFEGFFNSNAANSSYILASQFNPGLLDAKNPFLTGISLFGSVGYPVTPLINLSVAGIYNPSNRMVFIIPNFTFSLMNNLDLSLIAQSFQSYGPGTAGSSQTSVFLRLKGSF